MAYAHVDLVATAGQQNFGFSIPYLSQNDISVFKNGTLLVFTTDWTFLSAQVVRLVVGAAENDIIRVKRTTPIDEAIVDYANGSVLGENELDATALQSLFAAQEVADSLDGAITQNEFLQWDAQGLPIINLPVSSIPSSAVRRDFADSQVAAAAASASAAAGSASSASTSASTATTQASLATTARINAETAETNAELAETNAETAEVNAELAETNAEAAQAAAAASQSAAATSASTATTQASNAATSASNAATSASNALASEVAAAASAAKLQGTSTTSLLIEVASKVFTTQAGKFFDAGTWVLATSDANHSNYMHGQVTSYVTTSLTVNVTNIGGSGTKADWTIRVSGTRGAAGAAGANGADGLDGVGQPGVTVVTETAFGQSSAVGVSTTDFARVDHTHGTPTNPVTAHEAAGDPHTGYQKESEKDAASGYAGLTAGGKIQADAVETNSILADAVSNAKLANMTVSTIKGRLTAGTGDPEDLTAANVRTIINVAEGANNYVHPNHSGDVTSVADGAQTIVNNAVTFAKMQNVSAASKLLGRGSAGGAGDPEEITLGTNLSMSGTTLNATGGGGGDSLIYEFW